MPSLPPSGAVQGPHQTRQLVTDDCGLQPEHELQRVIDGPLLVGSEMSDAAVESMQVDGAKLLDQHTRHV